MNQGDLGNLKREVTANVFVKLSQIEQKVAEIFTKMIKQSETTKDTSSTL